MESYRLLQLSSCDLKMKSFCSVSVSQWSFYQLSLPQWILFELSSSWIIFQLLHFLHLCCFLFDNCIELLTVDFVTSTTLDLLLNNDVLFNRSWNLFTLLEFISKEEVFKNEKNNNEKNAGSFSLVVGIVQKYVIPKSLMKNEKLFFIFSKLSLRV